MRQYVKQIYKNTAFFARLYLKLEEDCKKTRKVKLFIFGLMKASPPTGMTFPQKGKSKPAHIFPPPE